MHFSFFYNFPFLSPPMLITGGKLAVGRSCAKKRIFGRTRFSPIGEKKIKASHARGIFFGENEASTRIFFYKKMHESPNGLYAGKKKPFTWRRPPREYGITGKKQTLPPLSLKLKPVFIVFPHARVSPSYQLTKKNHLFELP